MAFRTNARACACCDGFDVEPWRLGLEGESDFHVLATSYGTNAVGWLHGHTFKDLVQSDHAGFELRNPSGVVKLDFYIDYLTEKPGTPSGYGSLGPFGGDGAVVVGTLTTNDILFDTSMARNLNDLGYFVNGAQTAATLSATAGSPWELQAALKATSASEKMTPPGGVPWKFTMRGASWSVTRQ